MIGSALWAKSQGESRSNRGTTRVTNWFLTNAKAVLKCWLISCAKERLTKTMKDNRRILVLTGLIILVLLPEEAPGPVGVA